MAGNKSIKSFFKPSTSTNTPRKYPEDVLTSKHFKRNPPSIQKASPLPSSRLATALEQQDSPPSAPHLPMPDSNRVSSGLHSVLKPGTTVIRSSDDEYGDSDDGDLEELDALLRTRRQKVAGETPLPPEVSIKPARGRPRKKAPQNPCKPEIPQYKFSLESLVVQNKEQLAAASRSAQARAALHLLSRNDGEDGKRTGDRVDEPTAINKSLLASVVGESGEEAGMKKVLHALQRTEALNRGKAWSFFSPRKAAAKRPYHAFPTQVISDGWQHELIDPNMRIHTFLSGFAAEMMKLDNAFPDELRLWILDELCYETRDDLRYAYLHTLVQAAENSPLNKILDISKIDDLFSKCGGSAEAINLGLVATPIPEVHSNSLEHNRDRLLSIIKLLGNVANLLAPDAREHAICMLARLTLDASVVDDVEVWPAAQDAIALIASSIPPFAWDETVSQVSRSLISFVRDPQLRLQLINCLPVYVPRLHTLRRRLALAYFFEDSANITASADYLANIPRIIRHLQKPQFSINANTNYPVLGALMSLLDIGIDDGVSPDSFPDAESENLYNREVDSLATCIKAIFTRISDSGASHMARTEAKENIERIHHRLLYAVRTKEKPKIGIFGGNFGGVDDTPSGLMPKFLLKPKPSADHNG